MSISAYKHNVYNYFEHDVSTQSLYTLSMLQHFVHNISLIMFCISTVHYFSIATHNAPYVFQGLKCVQHVEHEITIAAHSFLAFDPGLAVHLLRMLHG